MKDIGFWMETLGWIGAFLLLLGYALNILNVINSRSKQYHLLNLAASAMLLVNTYWHGAFAPCFVNLIWGSLAIVTMFRERKIADAQ